MLLRKTHTVDTLDIGKVAGAYASGKHSVSSYKQQHAGLYNSLFKSLDVSVGQSISDAVEELAQRHGIANEYLDYRDQRACISLGTRAEILSCMGYQDLERCAEETLRLEHRQESCQVVPAIIVVHINETIAFNVTLRDIEWQQVLAFHIKYEDGHSTALTMVGSDQLETHAETIGGIHYSSRTVNLAVHPPVGYHKIELRYADGSMSRTFPLIVTPATCFQPGPLQSGQRIYGISVQLYSVRSERNWGIGDFTDLRHFLINAAGQGVDIVGINPMHALFPANPLHFSPYSPSNRSFLNVMYIDPEQLEDYAQCAAARLLVAASGFQQQLQALRLTPYVDYAGVAAAKFSVLELLYQHFADNELETESDRAREFKNFVANQGQPLLQHVTYEALHEHFYRQDWHIWGWPVWPEEYRNPKSIAVSEFRSENTARINYFMYLQWCASSQLKAAQQAALDAGMTIGIYTDLAVGADLSGSEVWANQDKFCLRATAGAPPDKLAREGQNWGFPPPNPKALRESGYELFAANLRAAMSLAGAVRFDHAVALLRLWWIPEGKSAAEGAYVGYSIHDLLGILALESHRHNCLVIGEDLGTVPQLLTEVMHEHHVYSYRVLYFENENGGMKLPADYPWEAVASVTTHDLPTLASWWVKSDLDLRAELGLLGCKATIDELRVERTADKKALLNAVASAGLWQGSVEVKCIPSMTAELNLAIHAFLASSRSAVMVCQLEDLQQMLEPVNVPGTFDEYPNWQRKVLLPIENFFERKPVADMCAAMAAQRSRS